LPHTRLSQTLPASLEPGPNFSSHYPAGFGGWPTLDPLEHLWVALDKSEGVVKRHFFFSMR